MKILSDSFVVLPSKIRFFCELWLELFDECTVDAFKVHSVNLHITIQELLEFLDIYKKSLKKRERNKKEGIHAWHYFLAISDELLDLVEALPLICEKLPFDALLNLLCSVKKQDCLGSLEFSALKAQLHAIDQQMEHYPEILLDALKAQLQEIPEEISAELLVRDHTATLGIVRKLTIELATELYLSYSREYLSLLLKRPMYLHKGGKENAFDVIKREIAKLRGQEYVCYVRLKVNANNPSIKNWEKFTGNVSLITDGSSSLKYLQKVEPKHESVIRVSLQKAKTIADEKKVRAAEICESNFESFVSLEKIEDGSTFVFFEIRHTGGDYTRIAESALARTKRELEHLQLGTNYGLIKIRDLMVFTDVNECAKPHFFRPIDINKIENYVQPTVGDSIERSHGNFVTILNSPIITDDSKHRLGTTCKFIHNAIKSVEIDKESVFLQLWIALEQLSRRVPHKHVIVFAKQAFNSPDDIAGCDVQRVKSVVSAMLSGEFIRYQTINLFHDCVRVIAGERLRSTGVRWAKPAERQACQMAVRRELTDFGANSWQTMLSIDISTKITPLILESKSPLLLYRFLYISEKLGLKSTRDQMVKNYARRLGQQITRIYLARNQIVHTGHTSYPLGPIIASTFDDLQRVLSKLIIDLVWRAENIKMGTISCESIFINAMNMFLKNHSEE